MKATDALPADKTQEMARTFCHLLLRCITAPSDDESSEGQGDSRALRRWLFSLSGDRNWVESFPFVKNVLMCNSHELISVVESVFVLFRT